MEPFHLLLEFVRAEDVATLHGAKAGGEQVYLMRDPDDTGRYAEGSFRWTQAVQEDIAALASIRSFEDAARRLAGLVHRFLAETPWERYAPLVDAAIEEGRGAVITVRSAAAELYALPWEWMPLARGPALRVPGCVVRYDWPDDELRVDRLVGLAEDEALARTEPQHAGRIVVAWSARGGSVPVVEHIQAIHAAADDGRLAFGWDTDVLPHVTRTGLRDALAASDDVAVLHLLCHGVRLPGDDGFGLAFDGDDGELDVVAPTELARLLSPFARLLRLVVVQACHGGNTGGLECHAGSVAQALHRAGVPVVLASRYPLSVPGSSRITERLYRSILVDLASTESAVLLARQAEVEIQGSFDWAALQLYADPDVGVDSRPIAFRPFRGLLPFESRHARFFFGRDADVAALVERLRELLRAGGPRFLLVAGASGSGKSSLVHAGLLPALAGGALPELAPEPETTPILFRPGERADDPSSLLAERLERSLATNAGSPLILVIDQLEELFTEVDDPARTSLMRALWRLADPAAGRCLILATVRIEYIGRFGEVPMDDEGHKFDAVTLDDRFRYFVRQLEPEQVDAIIEGPARAVGLRFEEGLVARLRADVGREPGALPLLSYTLDLLWQHRRGRWLKDQTYDALGRLVGALTKTADELYSSLTDPTRAQVRDLLVQLVHTAEDPAMATRRRGQIERLRPAEAASAAHFDAAVDALVGARLVVRASAGDDLTDLESAWVEIAHEALIRGWTRLQSWLREAREWLDYADELRAYAEAWSPHRDDLRESDYLLTGTRLAYTIELWSRHQAHLGGGDQRLLGGFVERCTLRQRAQIRRRRLLAATVFVALSVAAVVASVQAYRAGLARDDADDKTEIAEAQTRLAELKTKEAEARRQEALEEARRARNATRLAGAGILAERDPSTAALILNEVEEGEEALAGLEPLIRRLTAEPALAQRIIGGGDDAYYAMSGGEGRIVAVLYADGVVRLWDANTGEAMAGPLRLRDPDAEGQLAPVPRFLVAVALSPDGRTIATGTYEGVVQLWSADDGAPIGRQVGHEEAVQSLEFSGDNGLLLSVSGDGVARLWDGRTSAPSGAPIDFVEEGTRYASVKASFSAAGDAVITIAGVEVRLWSTRTGEPVAQGGDDSRVDPADDRVVLVGNGEVQLWSATADAPLSGPMDHFGVAGGSLADDGRVVVSVSLENVRLWDAQSGAPIGAPITYNGLGFSNRLRGAELSRDGELVLTSDTLGTIRMWRVSTGSPVGPSLFHDELISAEFSSDGRSIVSTSGDGSVRLWPAKERRGRVMTHDLSESDIMSARFSADGEAIVTASRDGSARIWSAETGEPSGAPMSHENTVTSAAFSSDGRRLVTTSGDRVYLWDAETGAALGEPMRHAGTVEHAEFSADGAAIVAFAYGEVARVWSVAGEPLGEPLERAWSVHRARFSPDGRAVLATSSSAAWAWTIASGELIGEPLTFDDDIDTASFSPDGRVVVSVSESGSAQLWDVATGSSFGAPMVHKGAVLDIAFSDDGRTVATAGGDGTVQVWDAASGEALHPPIVLDLGPLRELSFSPDGGKLVVGGLGDAAQLFDVRAGAPLGPPMSHDGQITGARFSPDGRRILTASRDGSARLWDAETGESLMESMWLRYLRRNFRGCLTPDARVEHLGVTRAQAAVDFAACEARQQARTTVTTMTDR